MVARKPVTRANSYSHCAGKAGRLRQTCMLVCAFFDAHCTRDRGCGAHPVFPAPSVFGGPTKCKTSGASRREIIGACLTTSLRAKRSNPSRHAKEGHAKEEWIASSLRSSQ